MSEVSTKATSLGAMMSFIESSVNTFVKNKYNGVCHIAEGMKEDAFRGYNNSVGPVVLLYLISEDCYGDAATTSATGMVIRTFALVVRRAKLLTSPRDNSLIKTIGPSSPFFEIVENVRDLTRALVFPTPMVKFVTYRNIKINEYAKEDMDSYVITFDVILALDRAVYVPDTLGDQGYIGVDAVPSNLMNTSF